MRESERVKASEPRMTAVRKMVQSQSFSDLISLIEDYDPTSDLPQSPYDGFVAARREGVGFGKAATIRAMIRIGSVAESAKAERPKQFTTRKA